MGTKNLYENGPNPFFLLGPKIWSGRLLWERKTYTKMDQIDRSGCVLIFLLTSLSLSMRGRYNNEIAE